MSDERHEDEVIADVYLAQVANEAREAAERLERVDAVVILSYTRFPKQGGATYHVEEIRAATPFLELHVGSWEGEPAREVLFDLRVGMWLREDQAKAVCLAVTDVRIVVYRAEVKRG